MDGRKEGGRGLSFSGPTGGRGGINKAITATTMKGRKKRRKKKMLISTMSTDYSGNKIHSTVLGVREDDK